MKRPFALLFSALLVLSAASTASAQLVSAKDGPIVYGHHHLNHGRSLDADPKLEEFDADRFALRIGFEVEEHVPLIAPNPYLSSGAGGIVMLLALKTLREFEEDFLGVPAAQAETHPEN